LLAGLGWAAGCDAVRWNTVAALPAGGCAPSSADAPATLPAVLWRPSPLQAAAAAPTPEDPAAAEAGEGEGDVADGKGGGEKRCTVPPPPPPPPLPTPPLPDTELGRLRLRVAPALKGDAARGGPGNTPAPAALTAEGDTSEDDLLNDGCGPGAIDDRGNAAAAKGLVMRGVLVLVVAATGEGVTVAANGRGNDAGPLGAGMLVAKAVTGK